MISVPRSTAADPHASSAASPDAAAVLVVDDDDLVSTALGELLARFGHEVRAAGSSAEAIEAVEERRNRGLAPFEVALVDIGLPDEDGTRLVRRLAERSPATVPIAMTGFGTIEGAVAAVRAGAIDYLVKPLVDEELRLAIERARQQHGLRAENARLHAQLDERDGLAGIVAGDPRMHRALEITEAVADSRTTVLVRGESGTGKSLIARAIHRASERRGGPFIELSCGSIPETLLESELFGHVQGAFTGAHADKPGRFRAADGGTIFLDEINSASPGMQLKLLRVLQERTFEPVGSSASIEVDVRVILATNQPLEELVAAGTFRQDLYYRINVVAVDLPPLRDRRSDVLRLARHFLEKKAAEAGRTVRRFDDDAIAALEAYAWPGNVRELENAVERAVVLSRGDVVTLRDLPDTLRPGGPAPSPAFGAAKATAATAADDDAPWIPMPLREALLEPERRILLKALEANGWNRQRTADELEINRTTLYKKMKQFGLGE